MRIYHMALGDLIRLVDLSPCFTGLAIFVTLFNPFNTSRFREEVYCKKKEFAPI